MVTCSSCGQENPEAARFCMSCAAPLAAPAPAPREERKVVTVLFCDLVGSTARAERLDPEDVRALLSRYHERVRAELERFGGTVEKFIGDAVMALFGAPVAHEDDPERAVRAALAIREWAQEAGELQVRIGITTGEALVALAARPDRGEGMASGDVVNTAARLQAGARVGGILVDETTYRATERVIEYREHEAVEAKGKAAPIAVSEPVEPRASFGVAVVERPATPLVGRERELNLLAEALARTREEREPQLVTLVGVPGIGKSRLVQELFELVARDPELIFWRQGRCLPYGEGISFWALGEMVKAQAGVLETDSPDVAARKLERAVVLVVAERADWVATHLRPLVGIASDTEVAGDRRHEAFAAWRAFFEALAERGPTVLVFEDLQWADEGLLDFVDELVDWTTDVPLLVMCTARPELLDRRAGWGGGKPNSATISLPALSNDETAQLVHAVVGRAALPAELQRTVLERSGGNPLYAEEFSRLVRERRSDGGSALPETVQGIVAARLDQLDSHEKALLQDASVLGKVFWLGAVAQLGGSERSVAERRLHALDRLEFVRRVRRSSVAAETEYVFRHIVVRDVAYGQIPRAARADKHARAAEWIESLGRPDDHAEMLAHHYLQALEYAEAAGREAPALARAARVSLRDAGERALALNAFEAAFRFFERAAQLWPAEDPDRALVLFHYGVALFWAREAGGEVLTEARDALLAAGDRERAAELEILLGDLVWKRAQRDEAFRHFERARALVAELPPSRAVASVLSQLSRFSMIAGEHERAIGLGRRALDIAKRLGLDEVRAHVLNNIGTARASSGDTEGIGDVEESIAIAEAIGSPEAQRAYVNLASLVFQFEGDIRRCRELHEKSLAVAERFGHGGGLRWVRRERVLDLYWLGDWDEALRWANELVAEGESGFPHYLDAFCRLARASITLARGDEERALVDLEPALALARGAKDPQILFPVLAWSARILVHAGRPADAGRLTDELVAVIRDHTYVDVWLFHVAVVLSKLGRANDAVRLEQQATRPTRWLDAARTYLRADFRAAADMLGEMGILPDEAHARVLAAEELIRAGKRADANREFQRALEFWRSVGATRYVREAEALLEGTSRRAS